MSKSLEGPWIAPKDDAFDGRSYYAGRTFELNGQRILFGWVATKDQDDDDNNFIWAGTFMAHEVYQREDGTLGVRIPETVWNAFDKEEKTEDFKKKIYYDGSCDIFNSACSSYCEYNIGAEKNIGSKSGICF